VCRSIGLRQRGVAGPLLVPAPQFATRTLTSCGGISGRHSLDCIGRGRDLARSTTGRMKMRNIRGIALASMLALAAIPSWALPIAATGTTTLAIRSYSGQTGGINVDLGGASFNTGTLEYYVDPTTGPNLFSYDWDTRTATVNISLLVTSPILSSNGVSPIPITIVETGNFSAAPLVEPSVDNQTIVLPGSVMMTGGGTVVTGPLAGYQFSNDNCWFCNNNIEISDNKVDINAGIQVSPTINVPINTQHFGNISAPGGIVQASNGTGSGMVSGIPEPTTWTLAISGLGVLGVAIRRRRAAQQQVER
jgi:PEP-CTERM motif